jgi:isoquinoline 1-oxidoreductase subunit alpha
MDNSASSVTPSHEPAGEPEHVLLDVVNYNQVADESVTRRRILAGGAAALIAAGVTGVSNIDTASARTTQKKAASEPKHLMINVNGRNHHVKSSPDAMLLYVLRSELQLHSPRFGCGLSQCGSCAVLLNGKQIRSCVTPVGGAADVNGNNKITTVEGLPALWAQERRAKRSPVKGPAKRPHTELATAHPLHPVQQAWIDQGVPQCGYCQSGMMIQAVDLLSKHSNPTEAQIKKAMNGHLCRCGTYTAIIEAIREAAKAIAKHAG